MTKNEIALIKGSWNIFQSIDPLLVGDVFYSKLFTDAPKLKQLFRSSKEEQSKKLIEMLNILVGRLDRLHQLSDDIIQLAKRHVNYGVRPEHYKAVGSALLWTLEQGLGRDWNKEVRDAWIVCYTFLSTTMINASEPAEANP